MAMLNSQRVISYKNWTILTDVEWWLGWCWSSFHKSSGSTKASPKYFNPKTKHVGQWEIIIPGGMEKNGVNWTELTHEKNESNHSNFVQNLCWEKNETPQGAVFLCLHAPPNAQQHSKHAQRQLPRRPTSLCWHEGNQHLALLLSTKTHRSFQQRSETASGCLYI